MSSNATDFLTLSAGRKDVNTRKISGVQRLREPLFWALAFSITLHMVLVVVIPKLNIDEIKKPDLIEVTILPPPAPEPVEIQPEAPPEVVTPPEKIKPKVEPKPIIKPTPKPVPLPEPATEAVEAPPPVTDVIAVQKTESVAAPIVAPEPKPAPPPPQPRIVDTSAAKNGYGNTLWGAISKHKKYPRIAQARGWQGEVILELLLDGDGKLLSKTIIQKSGYDVLDQQALEMVDKAIPFPAPPDALRGTSFSIKVPIPFKLEAR